jgi:hypothetical protein
MAVVHLAIRYYRSSWRPRCKQVGAVVLSHDWEAVTCGKCREHMRHHHCDGTLNPE